MIEIFCYASLNHFISTYSLDFSLATNCMMGRVVVESDCQDLVVFGFRDG